MRDVEFRQQDCPERLPGPDEVMKIGARVTARGWPRALFVERPWIVGVAGVAQVDLAEPRERHPVTAVARRHHAIEHVDAPRHPLQNIFARADTHQIPPAILRLARPPPPPPPPPHPPPL